MRRFTVLLSTLALGCAHVPKESAAIPRTPAAHRDAEGVSRNHLAVSSELGKALVMTVVQDRTLVFETCNLDANSLNTNDDIVRTLNSGSSECVNLNATTFDATEVRAVDAIFRQYFEEQKSIVNGEVATNQLAPVAGAFFFGLAAFNITKLSYNLLRSSFDRSVGSKFSERMIARSFGVLAALFDVALIGATAATVANARAQFDASKPATIEVAMKEYAASQKMSATQVPFTSAEYFNILVRSMRRATSRIDNKLRSL